MIMESHNRTRLFEKKKSRESRREKVFADRENTGRTVFRRRFSVIRTVRPGKIGFM